LEIPLANDLVVGQVMIMGYLLDLWSRRLLERIPHHAKTHARPGRTD
jgi:hypothetical protein